VVPLAPTWSWDPLVLPEVALEASADALVALNGEDLAAIAGREQAAGA
jgi:hypothetical protein